MIRPIGFQIITSLAGKKKTQFTMTVRKAEHQEAFNAC